MFNKILKNNFPFAAGFFEKALNSTSGVSHAYLLTGSDPVAQYLFALEVAKALNCQNNAEPECDCLNCSWIKENRHPAVITVSPIDYTYGKEDKSKTVINVDQTRYLRNELATSSQYHRVVIFTDAVEEEIPSEYSNLLIPPAVDTVTEDRIWSPKPLTYKILQDSAANSLLKTIEEPGSKITFFFLTKDKEDMINTIVSRCQTVPVNSRDLKNIDTSVLDEFMKAFPPKTKLDTVLASERLHEISNTTSLPLDRLLEMMEEHFRRMLAANTSNRNVVYKLIDWIRKTEHARNEISSYVNSNATIESLFLSML